MDMRRTSKRFPRRFYALRKGTAHGIPALAGQRLLRPHLNTIAAASTGNTAPAKAGTPCAVEVRARCRISRSLVSL